MDVNLLIQTGTPQELIAPKDFTLDKKVEQPLSFDTIERVCNNVDFGVAKSIIKDYIALLLAFMFSKLQLHTVNALNVPSKHRAYYLYVSMMFFVTIQGINPISKRNMYWNLHAIYSFAYDRILRKFIIAQASFASTCLEIFNKR